MADDSKTQSEERRVPVRGVRTISEFKFMDEPGATLRYTVIVRDTVPFQTENCTVTLADLVNISTRGKYGNLHTVSSLARAVYAATHLEFVALKQAPASVLEFMGICQAILDPMRGCDIVIVKRSGETAPVPYRTPNGTKYELLAKIPHMSAPNLIAFVGQTFRKLYELNDETLADFHLSHIWFGPQTLWPPTPIAVFPQQQVDGTNHKIVYKQSSDRQKKEPKENAFVSALIGFDNYIRYQDRMSRKDNKQHQTELLHGDQIERELWEKHRYA